MEHSFDDQIIPVCAALRPNGAIEVELLIPGFDEPSIVEIPAMRETRALARPNVRVSIMLDADWDENNAKLRKIVNEFVKRAEESRRLKLRSAEAAARV